MTRFQRALVVITLALLAIPLLSSIAIAGAVAHSGLIRVEIEERSADGLNLFVPVPALLVEVALAVVPVVLADDELDRIRRDAAPWAPALLKAAEAFEAIPDATLIEVRDGSEQVSVRKTGNRLEIEIDEPDLHVEVTLPVRTLRRSITWVVGS